MSSKSKRNALRWSCNGHLVAYKTAYDEGEACMINISSTGCLFESATLPLSDGEKIMICISLEDDQKVIEAKAVIIRVDEKHVAAEFTLIEPETQALIRTYFTQKLRNN